MKKKSELKIIILLFGLIFVISTINNLNFSNDQLNNDDNVEIKGVPNSDPPKASGAWVKVLDNITIDPTGATVGALTWAQALGEDWCNIKNGYYVIENVTIDASSSPTGNGIFINNSKKDYFMINNCTVYDSGTGLVDAGIKLENTNNGTLINNNCSKNGNNGIYLTDYCYNNTISGNTVNNNKWYGIHIFETGEDNIISGNTANNNGGGIRLMGTCDNNNITGNTVNNNTGNGIEFSSYCDDNKILENTVNDNAGGISLIIDCDTNTISGNMINNNDDNGIKLNSECDTNTISENYLYLNAMEAIYIFSVDCDDNIIKKNVLASADEKYIDDDGSTTQIGVNLNLTSAPSLCVEIVNQSFSKAEFVITINISSGFNHFREYNFDFTIVSIQMWWDGDIVPSNDISELGFASYKVSLTPKLVQPGGDPILFNMTISATKHWDKYYKLHLGVDPKAVSGITAPPLIGDDDDDDDGDDDIGVDIVFTAIVAIACVGACIGVIYVLIKKRIIHKSQR